MKIGLTGATGFIGRAFASLAQAAGHEVVAFTRRPAQGPWEEQRALLPVAEADFSGLDTLVHLAGEPIMGVWTKKKKQRIYDSRILLTKEVCQRLQACPQRPHVFVMASGISYYGNRGDEELDERSGRGGGFLADVVTDWEAAAHPLSAFARVSALRFGMVLGKESGAGPLLKRVFKLCLGGNLGSGKQWAPWIHIRDAAGLILHAIENPAVHGPVNGVAPELVRFSAWVQAIAKSVKRPAILPVPAIALRLLPGGMADLFLDSVRACPSVALETGYKFLFPQLQSACDDVFR